MIRNRLVTTLLQQTDATDEYNEAVSMFTMPHLNALRYLVSTEGQRTIIGTLLRKALPHRGMYRVFERALRQALKSPRSKEWLTSVMLWSFHGSYTWNTVTVPCWRRFQLYDQFVKRPLTNEWILAHGRLVLFAIRERLLLLVQNDGALRAVISPQWVRFENETIKQMNEIRSLTAQHGMSDAMILRRRSVRRPRSFNVFVPLSISQAKPDSGKETWLRSTEPPPILPMNITTLDKLQTLANCVRSWHGLSFERHMVRSTSSLGAYKDRVNALQPLERKRLAYTAWITFWADTVILRRAPLHHLEQQTKVLRCRNDLSTESSVDATLWCCVRCRTSKHNLPKKAKKGVPVKVGPETNLAFGHHGVLWDAANERVLCAPCTKQNKAAVACLKVDALGVTITLDKRTYGVCEGCGAVSQYVSPWHCAHCTNVVVEELRHCEFCMVKSARLSKTTVYNDMDAHKKQCSPWQFVTLCPSHSYGLNTGCVYLKTNLWARLSG